MDIPPSPSYFIVLSYVANHLSILGWPAIVVGIWKFRGAFSSFVTNVAAVAQRTEDIQRGVSEVKQQTETMSSNHLFHIEKELADQTPILRDVASGIRVLVDRPRTEL